MMEVPVREIKSIQGTVANAIIFTMVAGVDDGAEHRATWRFEWKGIKGHGKGGNGMKHTRPCHPLSNPLYNRPLVKEAPLGAAKRNPTLRWPAAGCLNPSELYPFHGYAYLVLQDLHSDT